MAAGGGVSSNFDPLDVTQYTFDELRAAVEAAENAAEQGKQLAKMLQWGSSAEALQRATSVNGELLAMSGLRSPYPGKLGLVEEGLADLLLVNDDPIENIELIGEPESSVVVTMKDGKIYKNSTK